MLSLFSTTFSSSTNIVFAQTLSTVILWIFCWISNWYIAVWNKSTTFFPLCLPLEATKSNANGLQTRHHQQNTPLLPTDVQPSTVKEILDLVNWRTRTNFNFRQFKLIQYFIPKCIFPSIVNRLFRFLKKGWVGSYAFDIPSKFNEIFLWNYCQIFHQK